MRIKAFAFFLLTTLQSQAFQNSCEFKFVWGHGHQVTGYIKKNTNDSSTCIAGLGCELDKAKDSNSGNLKDRVIQKSAVGEWMTPFNLDLFDKVLTHWYEEGNFTLDADKYFKYDPLAYKAMNGGMNPENPNIDFENLMIISSAYYRERTFFDSHFSKLAKHDPNVNKTPLRQKEKFLEDNLKKRFANYLRAKDKVYNTMAPVNSIGFFRMSQKNWLALMVEAANSKNRLGSKKSTFRFLKNGEFHERCTEFHFEFNCIEDTLKADDSYAEDPLNQTMWDKRIHLATKTTVKDRGGKKLNTTLKKCATITDQFSGEKIDIYNVPIKCGQRIQIGYEDLVKVINGCSDKIKESNIATANRYLRETSKKKH